MDSGATCSGPSPQDSSYLRVQRTGWPLVGVAERLPELLGGGRVVLNQTGTRAAPPPFWRARRGGDGMRGGDGDGDLEGWGEAAGTPSLILPRSRRT